MSDLPGRLARWNVQLEYGITSDGTLFALPGKDVAEVPLLLVSRFEGGHLMLFHEKVPRIARLRLDELGEETVLESPEKVVDVLAETRVAGPLAQAGPFSEGTFFTTSPSLVESPEVVEREGQQVVLREGRVVARAWTVRENAWCAEVAVETVPEHRREGLGRQVAAAWARRVIGSGRVAFCSYRKENGPSAALARSLGLHHYATSREYADRPLGRSRG